MITITLITVMAAVIAYVLFAAENNTLGNEKNKVRHTFLILAVVAFVVRISCMFFYPGHETDMNCFYTWSNLLRSEGLGGFYTSNAFTDYPPGYMYILYLIGIIRKVFDCSREFSYILLKIPAVIADIFCALIVYKLSQKNSSSKISAVLASFFLFNPAVILNSSIWGQVDSVLTVFVLISLYWLSLGKTYRAYFAYAIAIFIKPQALFYAPVILYGIIDNVFLKDFSKSKLLKNLLVGIASIGTIVLLAVPFGLENVILQYQSTIASYNYMSVNAYNLWTALGSNWVVPNNFINIISYFMIFVIVAVSAVIFFSRKAENRYFYAAAFICFSIFVLSVRMHERYAFPAIAFMLCALAISRKKEEFWLFLGISGTQFFNMAHTLFYFKPETYYQYSHTPEILTGWITVLVFAYMCVHSYRTYYKKSGIIAGDVEKATSKITRRDVIIMLIITALYSIPALYDLGSREAPQTYDIVPKDSSVTFDLGTDTEISDVRIYLGPSELSSERTLTLSVSAEDGEQNFLYERSNGTVFYWNEQSVNSVGRYITLSAKDPVYIVEMAVYDADGNIVTPVEQGSAFFDEQELIPETFTFRNNTYFDEIYHARTAFEFLNDIHVYEWTHPPLGKVFISLGVKLFGMTGFGWRIVGTLFGIFMIPIIYIFLKKMFKLTWLTVCATLLFSFDFMHFAQTRIATIDVYVTFFIMLMYLFMYKYYTMSFKDTPIEKTFVPLGLSGLCMGLAIACKWTGIYAAIGLAVIFFISLYQKYKEAPANFADKCLKTVIFCFVAFVTVPVIIYALSYIPFVRCNDTGVNGIIQNQVDMLTYHGKTVVDATHAFSSHWYEWPVMIRPIWYYTGKVDGLQENINSFGNPLVWWAGILSVAYCIYDAIKNKDKTAIFLVIAYFSQLVPWMPITRITFIYHYFPCVPFVVLTIAHTVHKFYSHNIRFKKYFIAYTVLAIILFVLFYPVLSGLPINGEYISEFLRWLPTWQLGA